MGRSWVLEYGCQVKSSNQERRDHWAVQAAHKKELREAFYVLAVQQQIPALDYVAVDVKQIVHPGDKALDPGNLAPTCKGAVDGLQDAGVIREDTFQHVRILSFCPPIVDAEKQRGIHIKLWEAERGL